MQEVPAMISDEQFTNKSFDIPYLSSSNGTIDPSLLFGEEELHQEFRNYTNQTLQRFQEQVPPIYANPIPVNHLLDFFPHLFNSGTCSLSEQVQAELKALLSEHPHFLSCNTHAYSGCTLERNEYYRACQTFNVDPIPMYEYGLIHALNELVRSEWYKGYTLRKEDSKRFFQADMAILEYAFKHYMREIALELDSRTGRYHSYAHNCTQYFIESGIEKYTKRQHYQYRSSLDEKHQVLIRWSSVDNACPIGPKTVIAEALTNAVKEPHRITLIRFIDSVPMKLFKTRNCIMDSIVQLNIPYPSIMFVDCSKHQSMTMLKEAISSTEFEFIVVWNVHLLGLHILSELINHIPCNGCQKYPLIILMYDMDFLSDSSKYLSTINNDLVHIVDAARFVQKTNDNAFDIDHKFFTPEYETKQGLINVCYFQKQFPVPEAAIANAAITLNNPVVWSNLHGLDRIIRHYNDTSKRNPWDISFVVSSLREKEHLLPLITKARFSTSEEEYEELGIGSPVKEGCKYYHTEDIATMPQQATYVFEDMDKPGVTLVHLRSCDGSTSEIQDASKIIAAECDVLEHVRLRYQAIIYYSETEAITRDIFYKLCSLAVQRIIIVCPKKNLHIS